MIPLGAKVWIAMGHTNIRKGMQGLSLMVQQQFHRDPHAGDLFGQCKLFGYGFTVAANHRSRLFCWSAETHGLREAKSPLSACLR